MYKSIGAILDQFWTITRAKNRRKATEFSQQTPYSISYISNLTENNYDTVFNATETQRRFLLRRYKRRNADENR